jgi:prevent-host-death family protein
MLNAETMADYLAIADNSLSVRDAKAHFSDIIAELDDNPVLVNMQGKPKAVIVEAHQYQEMLAKAEAYEVLAAYNKARTETPMTLEEFNYSTDALLAELAAEEEAEGA